MAVNISLTGLHLEVAREADMTEVMAQSLAHWKLMCAALQNRLAGAVDDDCEWKTRFEVQQSYNQVLEQREKEILWNMENQKQCLKQLKDGSTFDIDGTDPGSLKKTITRLNRDIYNLESELKNLDWRIDQESKDFYKVDEKRKQILNDVSSARCKVVEAEELKAKEMEEKALKNIQKLTNAKQLKHARKGAGSYAARAKKLTEIQRASAAPVEDRRRTRGVAVKRHNPVNAKEQSVRRELEEEDCVPADIANRPFNIPEDRRVLDPSKGPVNKTAGVRQLPPIDYPQQDPDGESADD